MSTHSKTSIRVGGISLSLSRPTSSLVPLGASSSGHDRDADRAVGRPGLLHRRARGEVARARCLVRNALCAAAPLPPMCDGGPTRHESGVCLGGRLTSLVCLRASQIARALSGSVRAAARACQFPRLERVRSAQIPARYTMMAREKPARMTIRAGPFGQLSLVRICE